MWFLLLVFAAHADEPLYYRYPEVAYAHPFKSEAECKEQGDKEARVYLNHPAKKETKGFKMACIQDQDLEKTIEHILLNERRA